MIEDGWQRWGGREVLVVVGSDGWNGVAFLSSDAADLDGGVSEK